MENDITPEDSEILSRFRGLPMFDDLFVAVIFVLNLNPEHCFADVKNSVISDFLYFCKIGIRIYQCNVMQLRGIFELMKLHVYFIKTCTLFSEEERDLSSEDERELRDSKLTRTTITINYDASDCLK